MPAVMFPTAALNSLRFGAVALGKCYIGQVDLNPRVLGNRVDVTVIQEDGVAVIIAPEEQPFILNAAGMFTYNGSVVMLTTVASYSLALDTAQDVQVYYLPNAGETCGGGSIHLEIVDGVITIDWDVAQYFYYTNTETHVINFVNMPVINDGIGKSIAVWIQDAGNYGYELAPEVGFSIYRQRTASLVNPTVDGLDCLIGTVYTSFMLMVSPKNDWIPN